VPTMLRHTPTGDIYPFNPDLASRPDMEQLDQFGAPTIEPAPEEPPTKKVGKAAGTKANPSGLLSDEFLARVGDDEPE